MAMQKLIYKARSRGQKTEADQAQREIDRLQARLAEYERDLIDEHTGSDRSQDTDWLRAGFLQRGAEIERLEEIIEHYERQTIQRDESVPDFARSWAKEPRGHCWWIGDRNRRIADVLVEPAPDLRPDIEGLITLPIVDLDTP